MIGNESGRDRLASVQAMSAQERREAIEAGVIEDLEAAPAEVRAFAERARRRYLAEHPPG